MKRIAVIILTVLMLVSVVSCGKVKTNRTDIVPKNTFAKGITVAANGDLLLDGKKFYAYGVNLYDIFVNKRASNAEYDVETAFKTLHDAGIPVARINIGSYTVSDFAHYYYAPDEYFEALDAVIAAAEKYEIGIFASMCWNLNVIWEFCGEYCTSITNVSSETVKAAKQYYTDVVKRYKDSPAIWAWEFGNEYNLAADLCFVGLSYDYITSENISIFYKEISTAMREIDPYRLIVGGDSELSCRPASLRNNHNWVGDTVDDIVESTEFYAPSPMEAVSSHMYQYGTSGATVEETEFKNFDEAISMALEACHRLNKGYYIGEYGPGDFLNNGSGTFETNKHVLDLIHEATLKNKVQISMGWICVNNFLEEDDITEEPYKYWYNEIKRLNSELKTDGKQKSIESYWKKADKPIYNNDETVFHKLSDHLLGFGNPGTAIRITDGQAQGGGWSVNNYGTDAEVTLEDATLADGTTGKVFHLSNKAEDSSTMIKNTYLRTLKSDGKYKLSFYMKSNGVTGEGVSYKFLAPEFCSGTGVKNANENEWQLMEIIIDSPKVQKTSYSLTFYLMNQPGDVYIYGIKVTDCE